MSFLGENLKIVYIYIFKSYYHFDFIVSIKISKSPMHLYISAIFSASGHRDIHMAAHRSNIKRVISLLNTRTCACNCWGLYLGVYMVL